MFDYSYHCAKRQNHQKKGRPVSSASTLSFILAAKWTIPSDTSRSVQLCGAQGSPRSSNEMALACAVYQRNVRVSHTQVPHMNQKSSCPQSQAQAPVNVAELFQKLVASGLIPETTKVSDWATIAPQEQENAVKKVKCSTCDTLLPKSEYSGHLQWHFEEKQLCKVDVLRQDLSNFGNNGLKALVTLELQTYQRQMASIRCSSGNNCCAVCGEDFEQFFHEETEEWHLKNTVRQNGFTAHVPCGDNLNNLLSL